MKTVKCFVSMLLTICILFSTAFAEENTKSQSFLESVGGWFEQAWEDSTNWVSNAWVDASTWTVNAWADVTSWTAQAWDDSSKWVSQAWKDTSNWATVNWDEFIIWVNTVTSGDPFTWINDVVLDNGVVGYDEYADLRAFLDNNPTDIYVQKKYMEYLTRLSLLDADKGILWEMLQEWSKEKQLTLEQTSKLALPFLTRLLIEGETVIGKDAVFTGPVIGQYLLTILDAMELDSGKADMRLKILNKTLNSLVRPTIIGDVQQSILVTDDNYYIENFTFGNGKYQVIMIVSRKDETSQYPLLHGLSLKQISEKYFQYAEFGDTVKADAGPGVVAESIPFTYREIESGVTGKAFSIWADDRCYLFYMITDQEWNEEDYETWLNSIQLKGSSDISFEVDMESDGAFYGVNQTAQKYTINRIFDEAKFLVPMTGHGWAAERGNNLIDNIKGAIKGSHSTVIGDSNARNGADRITYNADGSAVLIQTKYYSSASRGIAACFDENGFRYIDHVENRPMAIEVPADQYEAALEYMKNHIENGDFKKWGYDVTDGDKAVEIVKKGNLTYQQAKHIAKAGTVESILYDSAHACITAGTSMGISAAITFAIDIWCGESIESAIKHSILQGLQTGGNAFIISVLSSQLAKSGLNTALIPASKVIVHALGPKVSAVIVNAFRPAGNAIYGAAAMQSAAKLLRGNMITATVTFVVLSAGDVYDIIQGKISWKQLAKNMGTTAVGIGGGIAGYIGGAALGTAILPGAGTVVGVICAVAAGWGASEGAKALADLIAEDDADEMIHIIEKEFSEIATEYFLNEDELDQAIKNVQQLVTADMLKEMFQYRDHEAFARQLIEMAIDPVVSQRAFVELPSEEEYSDYLTEALEAIYEDLGEEPVTD